MTKQAPCSSVPIKRLFERVTVWDFYDDRVNIRGFGARAWEGATLGGTLFSAVESLVDVSASLGPKLMPIHNCLFS